MRERKFQKGSELEIENGSITGREIEREREGDRERETDTDQIYRHTEGHAYRQSKGVCQTNLTPTYASVNPYN